MKKLLIVKLIPLFVILMYSNIFASKSVIQFNYINKSTNKIENLKEWQKNATKVMQDTYPFIAEKFNLKSSKKVKIIKVVIDDIPQFTKIVTKNNSKTMVVSASHINKNRVDSYTGLAYHLATYFLKNFKKKPLWLYSGIPSYIRCFVKKGKYRYEHTPPIFSFKKKYKDNVSLAYFIQLKKYPSHKLISYYTSAFFFKWIEEFYNPKFINLLVQEIQKKNFDIDTFFKKNTKKNVKTLWKKFTSQYKDLKENKVIVVNRSKQNIPKFDRFEKELKKSVKNFYSSVVNFFNIPNQKKMIIHVNIKDDIKVPAYALQNNGSITIWADWIIKNRSDIRGVLLHEFVHLVQNRNRTTNNYTYLTEGIADYVRCFLLDGNYRASWVPKYKTLKKESYKKNDKKMTDFLKRLAKSKKKYKEAYVTTAFYFKWIEDNYSKNFTVQLNKSISNKNFSFEEFCKKKTGKLPMKLWNEFENWSNSL